MEIFCNETLMVRGFYIQFYPERKQQRKERFLNITFLNVLQKAPEEILIEYLNEYADSKAFLSAQKEAQQNRILHGDSCIPSEQITSAYTANNTQYVWKNNIVYLQQTTC